MSEKNNEKKKTIKNEIEIEDENAAKDRHEKLYLLDDPRYRIKPMQQLVSACVGGLITTLVGEYSQCDMSNSFELSYLQMPAVTPLDVVKTRVQTQHATRNPKSIGKLCYVFHNGLMTHICKPNAEDCANATVHMDGKKMARPLRGAMDAFLKILCNDGFRALWSGLGPTLISALPSTMIYFVTYDYLKFNFTDFYYKYLSKPIEVEHEGFTLPLGQSFVSRRIPFVVPLMSGVCARSMVVTAVTPIEMVRIKMQSQYMTYSQIWQVLTNLIESQGIKGLWRGLPPTIMRDAPFSGTYWAVYETHKRIFSVTEPTFAFSFISGAVSGTVATIVTMPFDLITTHTQIELGNDLLYDERDKNQSNVNSGKPRRQTVFERLGAIYRNDGLSGLYVGMMPRLLRVVPACAIMISTFEYSKSFFFHYNARAEESGTQYFDL